MLKRLKAGKKPIDLTSVIFYDLETHDSTVLDIGYVDNIEIDITFCKLSDFINVIDSSKKDLTLIGHYGNNFDLLFLYKELIKVGWFMECGFSGGKIVFATFTKGELKHRFIDSYLIMGSSLAALSRFSVYGKVSIDVLPHILKETDSAAYYEYLRLDVLTLRDVLKRFLGFFETNYQLGGDVPYTAASLSMKIFRLHMKDSILVSSKKLRQYERDSYFGGICNCFKLGVMDVNVYDVNSMYPHCMVGHRYPTSYVGYWTNVFDPETVGLWKIRCSYDGFPFMYDCETRKLSSDGVFIVDTDTVLYLRMLTRIELERGYVYERTDYIFDYINDMYSERRRFQELGDDCASYALKLVMNSTYGKFGQKDTNKTVELYSRHKEMELLSTDVGYNIEDDFIIYDVEDKTPKSFPAISSLVTLHARRNLRILAETIGDVVYCDTDSIHTTNKNNQQTSTDLGGIKLEYSGTATYVGKKLYSLNGEKFVNKGVPKNSIKQKDLLFMLDDGRIDVNYQTLPTPKEVIFKGKQVGKTINRKRSIGKTQ